jgi:hypothetical protein
MHFIDQLIPGEPALADTADIFALRDRLHALFSGYGEVLRLDLVRADAGQTRRILCFVRMAREEEERALMQALGMGRFGGDLVLVLALDPPPQAHASWRPAPPRPGAAGLR